MQKNMVKTKRGAASFYIVAFSTLILVVVAVSFATVILSEITRTSNDDLSQSAYDSALAGIEDAKLAYTNYRKCKESGATSAEPTGTTLSCSDIIWWIEDDTDENNRCYMVGHILGKVGELNINEVGLGGLEISSGSVERTTNQAYTCVKINTSAEDYRATLGPSNPIIVKNMATGDKGTMNDIDKIRLSWYSVRSDAEDFLKFSNFEYNNSAIGKGVTFGGAGTPAATPPTMELQIIQTAETFSLSDFDKTYTNQTNRGTVYLVPTSDCAKSKVNGDNYIGSTRDVPKRDEAGNIVKDEAGNEVLRTCVNVIDSEQVVKTNNHEVTNKPFAVYCSNENEEWNCIADIYLPKAVNATGGDRLNDTFMVAVSLPYQKPETDFSIELIKEDPTGAESVVRIVNSQIEVDSTGRANDLYRRVKTRLETNDSEFGSAIPRYALQILGSGKTTKELVVTSEYDFKF